MAADFASTARRLRVLVVDDNRDCADTLVILLQHLGHDGRASYDADSGLASALDFRPQLVLLDLAMPAKDGFALLRDLRNGADYTKAMIVALSGFADNRHRELAAEAGFDAYIVKPCGLEDLRLILGVVQGRDSEIDRASA